MIKSSNNIKNSKIKGYILTELAIFLAIMGTLMYAMAKAAVPIMEQANAMAKQYEQVQVNLNQMYTPTERLEKMKLTMQNIEKTKGELTEDQKKLIEKTKAEAKEFSELASKIKDNQ